MCRTRGPKWVEQVFVAGALSMVQGAWCRAARQVLFRGCCLHRSLAQKWMSVWVGIGVGRALGPRVGVEG